MNYTISIVILYTITIVTVLWLLYPLVAKQETQKIQIYNELPPPPQIETHHWGYAWRPWWIRYGGVPGIKKVKYEKKVII